ncbi:hypothetical protein PABG_04019 [Paracoccidioides brasiliensis Pb03]|nr:hypothetical protein PABG_04019 [Paracoccidioides brasiliensis Pb03]
MAQGKLCAANPVHGRGPTVTRLVKNTRAEAVEVLHLPQNPEIILNQEQSRKMSRIRTWHRKAFSLNRESELRGLSIPEYQEDRTRFKLIVYVDEIFWPKDSGIMNDGRGEESVEVEAAKPARDGFVSR